MEQLHKQTNAAFDLLAAHKVGKEEKYNAFVCNLSALVTSIVDPGVVDRTPYRNKKKQKHQQPQQQLHVSSTDNNNTTTNTNTTITNAAANVVPLAARPSRQAATKAMANLKEPGLLAKMRHDVTVKLERISLNDMKKHGANDAADTAAAAESENDPNAANRRGSRGSGAATPTEQLTQAAARLSLQNQAEKSAAAATRVAAAIAMDESLIEMPSKETEIVSLTDDDESTVPAAAAAPAPPVAATELMPPPAAKPVVAPRKARTKKQQTADAKAAAAVRVKTEKLSLSAAASVAAAAVAEPTSNMRSTRSKQPKVPMPIVEVIRVMKQEVTADSVPAVLETAVAATTATANTTLESVYEDARAVNDDAAAEQPPPDHDEPMPELVDHSAPIVHRPSEEPVSHIDGYSSTKMPVMPAASTAATFQADSTYVQPASVADANATYVSNATFVQPNEPLAVNETFNMAAMGANSTAAVNVNETVCLGAAPTPPMAVAQIRSPCTPPPPSSLPHMNRASIMTEDCSDSEDDRPLMPAKTQRPQPVPISGKHHKELFNPCVQSPLKQKVAAFERCAQMGVPSPAPMRTTRTKTRQKTESADLTTKASATGGVESAIPKVHRSLLKAPSTPNLALKSIGMAYGTPSTPSRQHGGSTASLPAACNVGVPSTGYYSTQAAKRVGSTSGPGGTNLAASTSKLAHLNRPASAVKSSGRETSAEDVRRGLQDAADEKRRKREEKLKQVHLQRELREKERADKYAKQLQEKEEKARLEAERKRQLKERKDREAENKRAVEEIQRNLKMQALKDAERARAERELLEAERKEREQLDLQRIQTEKLVMQQKLKQNQQAMGKKPTKSNAGRYCFEMLNTDDETDDESHPVAGRPLPPAWSISGNREERIASQSHLPIAFAHGFFASESMTPNLKELFPNISEKQLRRNSSAVWNTPPRYSTMDVPRYN